MSGLAVSRHVPATTEHRPAKPGRVSPKIAKAVNLMFNGDCKTQKAAAERIGVSPTYLCTQLKKPAVQVYIARRTRETIANGTIRASTRLIELLDSQSDHVSLDATKHILAIEGIRPPDNGTNISIINNIQPGYVVKLRHHDDALLDVTPGVHDAQIERP